MNNTIFKLYFSSNYFLLNFNYFIIILCLSITLPQTCKSQCIVGEEEKIFTANGNGKTGSVQYWTVPNGVNSIRITVVGADGGDGSGKIGGKGAMASATFPIPSGTTLEIVVGQVGTDGLTAFDGGGGGGKSVVKPQNATDTDNLIIAGGGGGGGGNTAGGGGGGGDNIGLINGGLGGSVNGGGGDFNGGGGGGFNSNGHDFLNDTNGSGGEGGIDGIGGEGGINNTNVGGDGGFGGGGGGGCGFFNFLGGSGGGGGGGNGGNGGGGSGGSEGGSSFIGSNGIGGQVIVGEFGDGNKNNGSVTICYTVSDVDVPTLSQWGLILLALLLMITGTLYLIRIYNFL